MKRILTLTIFITFTLGLTHAQKTHEKYILSGGELIFSLADLGDNSGLDNILRFSPVFNAQSWRVYDYGDYGFFHGLSIRNIGFIVEDDASNTKVKIRTYNIGIPVGFKLAFTERSEMYVGYELELPFNYKQKTFINEDKEDKFNTWFSDRTPTLAHGVFVGFQFVSGTHIKFKYYLNNFFNKDYREVIDGIETRPYENFDVNVFYFALTFNVFRDLEVIIPGE